MSNEIKKTLKHAAGQAIDSNDNPAWFRQALQIYREVQFCAPDKLEEVPATVLERSRRTVFGAMFEKLQEARAGIGFLPLPFGRYLEEVAKKAAVELQPLLAGWGIPDVTCPTAATARAFAWLANELGLEFEQTFRHLRLSMAALQGFSEPVVATRLRGGKGGELAQVDAVLQSLEANAEYDERMFEELQRIQTVLRQFYAAK